METWNGSPDFQEPVDKTRFSLNGGVNGLQALDFGLWALGTTSIQEAESPKSKAQSPATVNVERHKRLEYVHRLLGFSFMTGLLQNGFYTDKSRFAKCETARKIGVFHFTNYPFSGSNG